jgi:hypothetical protein
MKYSIHKDELTKINYDLYKTLLGNHHEFYSSPGKEHYKLLSYFSTLFNKSIVLDMLIDFFGNIAKTEPS